MASESRRKANQKYDKDHIVGYYMKLNKSTDEDILIELEQHDNKQGFIKELIRRYIAENEKEVN